MKKKSNEKCWRFTTDHLGRFSSTFLRNFFAHKIWCLFCERRSVNYAHIWPIIRVLTVLVKTNGDFLPNTVCWCLFYWQKSLVKLTLCVHLGAIFINICVRLLRMIRMGDFFMPSSQPRAYWHTVLQKNCIPIILHFLLANHVKLLEKNKMHFAPI